MGPRLYPFNILSPSKLASFYRPFSTLQRLRHEFVPGTPACIADVQNTKVSLKRTSLPIKEELKEMFPTLLASGSEGMQQLEIQVDPVGGSILRSETPLRVSEIRSAYMVSDDVISSFNSFTTETKSLF